MKKRSRDEEVDELVKAAVKEALKKYKPESVEEDKKTATSIEKLTQQFNNVLADIIHEDGVEAKKVEEDLTQFTAIIRYPNEIDLDDIQNKLLKIDDGIAWINYEANGVREMKLTISFTTNKALKMQYLAQEQREAQQLLQKQQTADSATKTDAEMVLFTLKSNLLIDTSQKPVIQDRAIGEGIQIVSVTIAVQSPLKNHQIERIAAGQARKIKNLRIGPHPSVNTIRMTVEIYCSSVRQTD
jgi:hypothetical protein